MLNRVASGKEPTCNAGGIRDAGSIYESERYPGGGYGYPLQHFCLEKLMDWGAWWATVHSSELDITEVSTYNVQFFFFTYF